MIVQYYELRFTQLSRFTEAFITYEFDRIRRFVEGLRVNIQNEVTNVELTTCEKNVKRACWIEDYINQIAEEGTDHPKQAAVVGLIAAQEAETRRVTGAVLATTTSALCALWEH